MLYAIIIVEFGINYTATNSNYITYYMISHVPLHACIHPCNISWIKHFCDFTIYCTCVSNN